MSANRQSSLSQTGRTNSLSIAALVCGIVGFCFPLASIAAIILGHRGRSQIRRSGEEGYGLATAGAVLGYVAVALGVLGILIALVATASGP
jgi:hypothetical protein